MDKVLLKMARQLNAYDEASLMAMWEKYAGQVQNFEPTKRWEEAALIFGMIQALRWKNQLFNYNWAQESKPQENGSRPAGAPNLVDALVEQEFNPPVVTEAEKKESESGNGLGNGTGKRAKVLRFRPREDDESV